MNIAIDGYEANIKKRVGVGYYAFEVINNLNKIDSKNQYTIFLPNNPLPEFPKETISWKYSVTHTKGLWTFLFLPIALKLSKSKYDIFFTPTHYVPRFTTSLPKVISIMDLSFVYFPQMFKKSDLYKLTRWTDYSIKNSQKIITISQFTKSEIINYYHVPEEKVIVAYPGYDYKKFYPLSKNPQKDRLKLKTKYNINGDYLLFVGTLQPRKNIVKLIESFNIVVNLLKDKTLKLLIVGKKGWLYESIFRKITEAGVNSQILLLDYVPDSDMSLIYRYAKSLVLPSLYEGFGLPVIEAMACGTPTVISNVSSLPEIGGNASIYVDPNDAKSIAGGLINILRMDKLDRQKLINRGFNNIKRFDWERCSRIILNVLEE